jgi:hypothetical protein
MDWGDVPGWAAFVLAAAAFVLALFTYFMSRKYSRITAEAAVRAADAAEQANRLAEQRSQPTVDHVGDDTDPPDVRWRLERPGNKQRFVLRNVGTDVATRVHIDPESLEVAHRFLPDAATVAPGASHEFLLIGAWQAPLPNEIWLSWDGSGGPQAVAIP